MTTAHFGLALARANLRAGRVAHLTLLCYKGTGTVNRESPVGGSVAVRLLKANPKYVRSVPLFAVDRCLRVQPGKCIHIHHEAIENLSHQS